MEGKHNREMRRDFCTERIVLKTVALQALQALCDLKLWKPDNSPPGQRRSELFTNITITHAARGGLRIRTGLGGGIRLQLSEFVNGIDVGEGIGAVVIFGVKQHLNYIEAGIPLIDFALATF